MKHHPQVETVIKDIENAKATMGYVIKIKVIGEFYNCTSFCS